MVSPCVSALLLQTLLRVEVVEGLLNVGLLHALDIGILHLVPMLLYLLHFLFVRLVEGGASTLGEGLLYSSGFCPGGEFDSSDDELFITGG